jgi:WhiB family redox-sensing transcriptional regulator
MSNIDWRDRAACRGINPELFFVNGDSGRPTRAVTERRDRAKAICAGCPVIDDCLDWAYQIGDDWGVLGGTTPAERRGATEGINASVRVRVCALNGCDKKFIVDRRKPDQRYCDRTCTNRSNARAGRDARELVAA